MEYARRGTLATSELFEKLWAEHRRHPVDLDPVEVYFAASLAKAYLSTMGLLPRLDRDKPRVTAEVLGQTMQAYYGGRAECRIRHTSVPVELHDFTSMYPTVNALMGSWELLTADMINAVPAADEVRRLVAETDLGRLFDRAIWPQLRGIALVQPDGDILPTKAIYANDEGHTIGLNPMTSPTPMWFTIADVLAAKILTGKTPEVLDAVHFNASGRLSGPQPVSLPERSQSTPATTTSSSRSLRNVTNSAPASGHTPTSIRIGVRVRTEPDPVLRTRTSPPGPPCLAPPARADFTHRGPPRCWLMKRDLATSSQTHVGCEASGYFSDYIGLR